jgi:two-component system response regulator CpxR
MPKQNTAMEATDRVLVIDDDIALCKLVSQFLRGEGFLIDTVQNSVQGVTWAESGKYSFVVLDVMMPNMSGFDVLRRIRAKSRIPVLMLTARGDSTDRVLGLELGADDYLPKPFDPKELAARIRAILRRMNTGARSEEDLPAVPLTIGDIELDPGSRTVRKAERTLSITTVEFDLLQTLMREAGKTVERERLSREVLGREFSPFDRSIDTHVCNLRKKLGLLDDGAERIKGIRGIGYLYAPGSKAVK